jgi:hypothetical protein
LFVNNLTIDFRFIQDTISVREEESKPCCLHNSCKGNIPVNPSFIETSILGELIMHTPLHNFWTHKLFERLDDDLAIASTHCVGDIDISGLSSAYITHGVLLSIRANQMPTEVMCNYLRTLITAIEDKDEYLPCLRQLA